MLPRTPRLLGLVLLAALPLAGCFAPGSPAGADPTGGDPPEAVPADREPTPAEANATPTTGTLVVLVRMPDGTRLPGADVTVPPLTMQTDEEGLARFEALAPGFHNVTVTKAAHRTAQLGTRLEAGQETRLEAVLPADEGDKHAHEQGIFAHRDLYRFNGRFDCSATYVIITGDCMLLLDNLTTTAGLPLAPGNATDERNLIPFPLDLNWTALVVELAWSQPNPAMGRGMTLALEPGEAPPDGHAVKYARTAGESPLRLDLRAGVKHETATAEDMPNPLGGEVLRARAYVMGEAHNPGGTTFLGVGASLQHEFNLYVSVFYAMEPAQGYTAIGS